MREAQIQVVSELQAVALIWCERGGRRLNAVRWGHTENLGSGVMLSLLRRTKNGR